MAQAPATPKARRLAIRAWVALLGPTRAARHLTLQASEAAALERRANAPALTAPAPHVVFLIPLVSRAHVGDWDMVVTRLKRTIESFRDQTDTSWRAVICGQDKPEGIAFDDQLTFLPFTDVIEGNDKWPKLAKLAGHLPALGLTSGYAMPFDADDLLAREAVAEMIARQSPAGYLVEKGLVLDAASQSVGHTAPQSLTSLGQKPFWKLCGSCAAFRFDLSQDDGDVAFLQAITSHEHRMFPYVSALAGRRLTPLRQTAALYFLNHGENFGARRGRVSFKTRFVQRFRVTDPDALARFEQAFPGAIPAPEKV